MKEQLKKVEQFANSFNIHVYENHMISQLYSY